MSVISLNMPNQTPTNVTLMTTVETEPVLGLASCGFQRLVILAGRADYAPKDCKPFLDKPNHCYNFLKFKTGAPRDKLVYFHHCMHLCCYSFCLEILDPKKLAKCRNSKISSVKAACNIPFFCQLNKIYGQNKSILWPSFHPGSQSSRRKTFLVLNELTLSVRNRMLLSVRVYRVLSVLACNPLLITSINQ